MRQQLISWLVDDLAPEIRKSRDAEGTILKFASDKNLAPSLVQAMGQLYNTAKTIAFLEKAGSKSRGDSFPILDVDGLVSKYMDMPKEAGIPEGTIDEWILDNPDGVMSDLPACFEGILTPGFKSEEVITVAPPQSVKRAFAEMDTIKVNREFAEQFVFDTREDMIKYAGEVIHNLRRIPEYTFEELEADVLALNGERLKPVMDKLAEFCKTSGWPVTRAKTASSNKLLDKHSTQLMELIGKIDDGVYRLQVAQDYLEKEGKKTKYSEPMDPGGENDIAMKDSDKPRPVASFNFDDIEDDAEVKKKEASLIKEAQQLQPPGTGTTVTVTGGLAPGGLATLPQEQRNIRFSMPKDLDKLKGKDTKPLEWGGAPDKIIDSLSGARESAMESLSKAFKGPNLEQERVDKSMLDARHMSVLSNLMTNDEILAEADPDRVVQLFNTIRETSPELASDVNVMRVLLRSAIAHDGISPFDLKSLIETELVKQKVDYNQRLRKAMDYEGVKFESPKARQQQ